MTTTRMYSPPASTNTGALRQFVEITLLVGVVCGLAIAHLAAVARPAYVLGAMLVAALALRRSPWLYLTATLWFWSISPFVRRIIDYYSGFSPGSVVLLTPNLLALFMIKPILTSSGLMKSPQAAGGLLLLGPVLYGLILSFFQGDIFPGLVATTDWVIPLLYFFYVLHLTPRIEEAEPYFRAFVPLNLAVVAGYGLYQCFSTPAWDMAWVVNVKMFSISNSALFKLKPFSLLSSPGTCAAWVGTLILLSLHFRNRASILILPAAMLFLALTQVRANLGAVIFGIAIALLSGQRQMVRALAMFLAVLAIALGTLSALDPQVQDTLAARFGTVGNLSGDESAQARTELYKTLPDLLAKYPLGVGIGAIGRGAVAGNGGDTHGDFVNIDGGPVAIYLALGWVAGTIYMGGILLITGQAFAAARRSGSSVTWALAITAAGGVVTLLFTNLVGFQGLMAWLPCAYAIAIGSRFRTVQSLVRVRNALITSRRAAFFPGLRTR